MQAKLAQLYNMCVRKEKYTKGSIVHVLNRGAKKMPIYRKDGDFWRLLSNFFYMNCKNTPRNLFRTLEEGGKSSKLIWLNEWGEKDPLVNIMAFTIMPNHFHLVLEELDEDGRGIPKFMLKISSGYSKYINAKYDESGSLFEGTYKAVVVEKDSHFNQLAYYVMVKNTFEVYPGGFKKACKDFDKAYKWASTEYPFTSLGDYAGERESPIITKSIFGRDFGDPKKFKKEAKRFVLDRLDRMENELKLE